MNKKIIYEIGDTVEFRHNGKYGYVGTIESITQIRGLCYYYNILTLDKQRFFKMKSFDDIGREEDFTVYPEQPKS